MRTAIERTGPVSKAIVVALRARLRAVAAEREDRIDERMSQQWISWRSRKGNRIFAEIRPSRERVEVFLLPSPRDLRDGSGLAKRAPPTQGWGWFRTRLDLRSIRQVASAASLVRQSYLHGLRPNGHAHRRRSKQRA